MTNHKYIILILFFQLLCGRIILAQNINDYERLRISGEDMQLNIKSSNIFTYYYSGMDSSFILSTINPALYFPFRHRLVSKDKHFCCYIDFQKILSWEDSARIFSMPAFTSRTTRNTAYLTMTENNLRYSLGENYISLEKSPIKYKTVKYAKRKFNADLIFQYPMNLKKGNFQNLYNHCNIVIISKAERGYFALYCLYDNQGKNELKKYQKEIEYMFQFREPEEFIPIQPRWNAPDEIIIHPKHKVKKVIF